MKQDTIQWNAGYAILQIVQFSTYKMMITFKYTAKIL